LNSFGAFSSKFFNCLDWCKTAITCRGYIKREKMIKYVGKIVLYILFNLVLSGVDTGTDVWAAKTHFE
jgi:hypothetical protein